MKKATKCLLGGALVILLLTPVSQVKADWHQDNIGWWYSLNNGSYYKNQEVYIDGKDYKFDSRGYMITGWQYNVYNGGDYSGWYYYDPVNGDKKMGWQLIDGKWYYLSAFGARFGGQNIDGKQYYFDPVNCDMKTGWISYPGYSGTEWNYYDPVSGEKATGWRNIDGKWYYFLPHALKGFQKIGDKSYYFDPVNSDMKTGWISKQGYPGLEWYYYDPESGEQLSGWQEIDGKKYYLTSNGAYSGHIYTIDGKRYYFDPVTRELITGWFELYGSKYYADPNDGGALASNKTLVIDGVSYTFSSGGSVINNEP
ncbi:MAG: N-acetylmuramoyl-L-alanine amidase family protein [Streptococcus sp.]|uniref:N-acetylmuramoyl-L-alanine amidase family protein n=1 Tax=Streptococcus TaxID=1301 RepID=UPI00189D4469|nr:MULTISPECIES: N-acetylmuramoyl-L-alanine amidase family protein [Streptococcus]MBF1739214.1 N-acetylmuramoyl-L-alanine amidase family protein [Streptococcus sp.]